MVAPAVPPRRDGTTNHRVRALVVMLGVLGGLAGAQQPTLDVGAGVAVVPVEQVAKPAPLFFSASAQVQATVGLEEITEVIDLSLQVHQGKPEVLTLGLGQGGEVLSVAGEGLKDWAVRRGAEGARFLDIRPAAGEGDVLPQQLALKITAKAEVPENGNCGLLLLAPGRAVGFNQLVRVAKNTAIDWRVAKVEGLVSLDDDAGFSGAASSELVLSVRPSGAMPGPVELVGLALRGKTADDARGVSFVLTGELRVSEPGEATPLLAGRAALSGAAAGDGWHVRLAPDGKGWVYELVGERVGNFPLRIPFEAPVQRKGDWRIVDFRLPAGVIVPVALDGLGEKVSFDRALDVVPVRVDSTAKGFMPITGRAAMAWKSSRKEEEGALFFSSHEAGELRVGAGLLRQSSVFSFRVLQGKIDELVLGLDGDGEVLAVKGEQVLGWSVREEGGGRKLDVRLSRPIEGSGSIQVDAQSALAAFPVKASPLRMIPEGALRHSGHMRVANEGAVRLEVAGVRGMMQLAPTQFPGKELKGARQIFVYRFPSADYRFQISADQVLPEVSVNQVLVQELSETDRILHADLELDIREAPLREWELRVPADYVVASVTGQAVADFVPGSEEREGTRVLKVIFKQAVAGRQLVSMRLERNIQAGAGEWILPRLDFPDAKSVRGHLGVSSSPGYRITTDASEGLSELATAYFPKQIPGLQQAFRIKDAEWAATAAIEALGQSVHADVFHLYSLKEGVAYGSVLLNYYVVGAPASEWRVQLPLGVGNIEVTGQQVRRDWRTDESGEVPVLVVPLGKPVLGSATVLVTFEMPMSERGGDLSPGEVTPLGVQSERGHIQVVSPLQVNYGVSSSEGALLGLDPLELPPEYRLLTAHPTLGAWQYTARPFSLGLKVEWFDRGETVGQVIEFIDLSSRVSGDGQVVTDAQYMVKARGQSVLRLTLPKDAKLWEASVDGRVVNARLDDGETLVPLPAKLDPNNEPLMVKLRYGLASKKAGSPVLAAPSVAAPAVINQWTVKGDAGRRLVPAGGTAQLVGEPLTESGFEWVAERPAVCVVFVLLFLAMLAGRGKPGVGRGLLTLILGAATVVISVVLAIYAVSERRPQLAELEYVAPVVQAGESVIIELRNLEPWRALVNGSGIVLCLAGVAAAAWALIKRDGPVWRMPLAVLLFGLGVLAQRGGAAAFFLLLAIAWLLLAWIPTAIRWARTCRDAQREKTAAAEAAKSAANTGASVLIGGLLALGGFVADTAEAALPLGTKPAESLMHEWQIKDGRLHGEIDVSARGVEGDRFLLLRAPAVLTDFAGEGWRVVKGTDGKAEAYFLVAQRPGLLRGQATFEMPLPDPGAGWSVPSGPAAVQQVEVRWDEAGWEFHSPMAARVDPLVGLPKDASGAKLVLGPGDGVTVSAKPRSRDAAAEETRFFVETSNLFLPGPGVVNGRHKVTVRPAQGRVEELLLKVPEGFTVGDVTNGPVGSWRFDPRTRELRVAVEPAQEAGFSIHIETQQGTGALPVDVTLQPLRVAGDSGEVGLLALAFGGEAQPEEVVPDSMPVVNLDDFDGSLLPVDQKKQPLAVLQRVFRYQGDAGSVALKVVPVEPEVRLASTQVLSLGDDRLVLAADLVASITRSGVFRLTLEVPAELEVEALSSPALSHWTEADPEDGRKKITLHLNGRTIGDQKFAVSLVGQAPGTQESWPVPRLALIEATRHTGTLTVVPGRGLQVRPVSRRSVSQLDAREAGSMQPGALGFRLLQADWEVRLATSELDAWVTARVLHDVTLREGQVLTRVSIDYKVENAAVKRLRVRLPGLTEEEAATVRANGPALADFVRVAGAPDTWEMVFQRGVAGSTSVDIEYQRQRDGSGTDGREALVPLELEEVRQTTYFVAVRSAGRLQVEAIERPRGWQPVDWSVVKATVGDRGQPGLPALALRVSEPEGPLVLGLERHDLAGGVRLRVTEGTLTTLLSPNGSALTAVSLLVDVGEKGTLRLRPPGGSEVFNVFVNDEGAPLVRSGDEWLFYVFPNPEGNEPAAVRFVYSTPPTKKIKLVGPGLNVPLENLTWRVVVPEGFELDDHDGDFDLRHQRFVGSFGLEDYLSSVQEKRQSSAQAAVQMLEMGNKLRQAGQQVKAGQAFSQASKARSLDEASNEDARVQLQQLRTEQAVVGLNTRRQKQYFDNRFNEGAGPRNDQLEQAANINPVFQQGALNWAPQQVDQFLLGNTAEENTALKAIASRIVTQQLAAETAPVALDVMLPERGQVITFGRSVQVDGGDALELELELEPSRRSNLVIGLLLAAMAAVPVLLWKK